MEHFLEFLRVPTVVCIFSAIAGTGIGLAYQRDRASAVWGAAGAVGIASALVSALAPDAPLAAAALTLGFGATAALRVDARRRRAPEDNDED